MVGTTSRVLFADRECDRRTAGTYGLVDAFKDEMLAGANLHPRRRLAYALALRLIGTVSA
jgi:hypothetical protein